MAEYVWYLFKVCAGDGTPHGVSWRQNGDSAPDFEAQICPIHEGPYSDEAVEHKDPYP